MNDDPSQPSSALGDLPRLPDPLEGVSVPGPHEPAADELLKGVLMTRKPNSRPTKRVLLAIAAAVILALVTLQVLPGRDSVTPVAAEVLRAVDATASHDSGRFVTITDIESAGNSLHTETSVAFSADDLEVRIDYEGGIIQGEGAFTPDAIEIRRAGGQTAMRIEPMEPAWQESFQAAPGPAHSVTGRLRDIVEAAATLERCEDQTSGVSAYCVTTTDPEVASLGEMLGTQYVEASAVVRIEVDEATGLIIRVNVDAADIVIDTAALDGVDLPVIDRMQKETVLSDHGAEIVIEPAELGATS